MNNYFTPLKVLIAEDSRAMAHPLIFYLKQQGHTVFYATNGQEAIDLYNENIPDIVLMDVVMPVVDGIQATRVIKQKKTQKWIPLIMMTALSSDESLIEGLEAGADDYMIKPINFEVLEARMRSMQRISLIQDTLFGIVNNVIEGIITINHRGEIHSFNNAAESIFGYSAEDILNKNIDQLISNVFDPDNLISSQLFDFVGKTKTLIGIRKDGGLFPMQLGLTSININNKSGDLFIGLVRDITQQEKDRQRIEYLALHDNLTGLANRMKFNKELEKSLKMMNNQLFIGLMYLDIDGFKPINDTFGHSIGDQVLITIGKRLTEVVGRNGLVARLGGDEFVVLIAEQPEKLFTLTCAERIVNIIRQPMTFKNENNQNVDCLVGVSIGVAFAPEHGKDNHSLISASDSAMYIAKKNGKNQFVIAE